MNYNDARFILGLPQVWDRRELRNAYKSKALLYHPDKNPSKEANFEFDLVRRAYLYLQDKECLTTNESKKDILSMMSSFNLLDEAKVSRLFDACKEVINVTKDLMSEWRELKKGSSVEKTIRTNLKQMLNDEMYVMNFNSERLYVPLWYPHVHFELSNDTILSVTIITDLPENISIDDDNVIHVIIKKGQPFDIKSVISPRAICYNKIPNIQDTEIGKKIILKSAGLLKICDDKEDMNVSIRQDIIISIE